MLSDDVASHRLPRFLIKSINAAPVYDPKALRCARFM
jgi:hypothetical protein